MCIKRIKTIVNHLFTVFYEKISCLIHSLFNIFDTVKCLQPPGPHTITNQFNHY
jgi:hypothetical protein